MRMGLRSMQLFVYRFRVLKWWNQDLAAINSWCLKWPMRLNPKKMKSMVIGRSRTIAPGYDELTLFGAELKEVKSLLILGRWRLRHICGKSCQRQPAVLVSCAEHGSYLIVHVCSTAVSTRMFCPAWTIVPPCVCRLRNLIWVCWIVLFAVRKGPKVLWGWALLFGGQKKASAMCLLYKTYHRVDHPMNGHLQHVVATRITEASAARVNQLWWSRAS